MFVSGHGIAERGRAASSCSTTTSCFSSMPSTSLSRSFLPHGEPQWRLVVDTAEEPRTVDAQDRIWATQSYPLQGRSLALLRRTRPLP
jgi:hypothetical protein